MSNWQYPLIGGALIGLSASIMLLLHGRVTGISGIINNALNTKSPPQIWRYIFLAGFICGGLLMKFLLPENIAAADRSLGLYALAGLLVGYGTVLGSGCTSGHGVCGISRLSKRSIIATIVFMVVGLITTYLTRSL